MTEKDKISFDEPRTYGIAKYRLYYSITVILVIVGTTIYEKIPTPPICFAPMVLLAAYLFLPFTYKLIVSDGAISSMNLLGTRTLEWNEVAEIGIKRGNLILSNRDGDVRVTVNQQIDDYAEVIKFIKQQRPYLWTLDDIQTFHQKYLEKSFTALVGLAMPLVVIWVLFRDGFTRETGIVLVGSILFSAVLVIPSLFHIRKLSLEGEILVLQYLIWKRQFNVKDVWSVSVEQKYGKNIVVYPVHIRVRDKKDIVVEAVKEGNPLLVNAIEMWMKKYKGTTK